MRPVPLSRSAVRWPPRASRADAARPRSPRACPAARRGTRTVPRPRARRCSPGAPRRPRGRGRPRGRAAPRRRGPAEAAGSGEDPRISRTSLTSYSRPLGARVRAAARRKTRMPSRASATSTAPSLSGDDPACGPAPIQRFYPVRAAPLGVGGSSPSPRRTSCPRRARSRAFSSARSARPARFSLSPDLDRRS